MTENQAPDPAPRALEVAAEFSDDAACEWLDGYRRDMYAEASALLRSQHELIGELVEALAQLECKAKLGADMSPTKGVAGGFRVLAEFARAAIAKATGAQA